MIGLFNDCFPPIMDGVSVTTSNYAYWLNRKQGNVCVVTPQTPSAIDDNGYPVYRYLSLPIPIRKPYRLGAPRIDWPFHRQINKIPFELVHAHCPFSSGSLARSIARDHHIPMIATFHSKYHSDFERIIPNRYMIDRLICNIVAFYEQADEVWIPQASVEETLREYGYKGKVEVVDNGNDFAGIPYSTRLKAEAKQKLGLDADIPLLLFVGQHIWEKNVGFLLHTLARMQEIPFRMFFIGTGYAAGEMKQLADQLGLTASQNGCPKVSFTGAVSERETLKLYYLAADLFLFPSLYDNAPLVVRETAALHTPSILQTRRHRRRNHFGRCQRIPVYCQRSTVCRQNQRTAGQPATDRKCRSVCRTKPGTLLERHRGRRGRPVQPSDTAIQHELTDSRTEDTSSWQCCWVSLPLPVCFIETSRPMPSPDCTSAYRWRGGDSVDIALLCLPKCRNDVVLPPAHGMDAVVETSVQDKCALRIHLCRHSVVRKWKRTHLSVPI